MRRIIKGFPIWLADPAKYWILAVVFFRFSPSIFFAIVALSAKEFASVTDIVEYFVVKVNED